MSKRRYPSIFIRSKSELAKQISGRDLPYKEALALINDVLKNYDTYWSDHPERSKPEEGKYVRNAAGTKLGRLLKLIDKRVLKPHDSLVPGFLFGGLSGRNHIQAAVYLLGEQRGRTLRGLDITRFFEHVPEKRVFHFFYSKAECSKTVAQLLVRLCCISEGAKGSVGPKTLARGFATSSRLAVWCNLDTFIKLNWEARRQLAGHDPRIAVYVDDIGITASRVSKQRMGEVSEVLENMLAEASLPIQPSKSHTATYEEKTMQHLGIRLGRNKVTMDSKTRKKSDKVLQALKTAPPGEERKKLLRTKKAYKQYNHQMKKTLAAKTSRP